MPKSTASPAPVEFIVDPLTGGRITPRALIAPEGTVSLPFSRELMEKRKRVIICRIAGFGWYFNIGYLDGRLVIQRSGAELSIDEAWCRGKELPDCALASWKLDALILSFGTHLTHWDFPQAVVPAEPIPPPLEVVTWVRGQEMTPVTFFASQEEFAMRVHSSLQRFDERLGPVLSRDFFWDLERSGNRIVERKPKREIDVQAAIHSMLVDHMLLSNIDVQPEARSSAGSVDFLFSGTLQDGSRCRLCAEFKSAHSAELVSGLTDQLRHYMDATGTGNGAYCVLDFRGRDFALPAATTEQLLGRLHEADAAMPAGKRHPVKVHWFKLAGE